MFKFTPKCCCGGGSGDYHCGDTFGGPRHYFGCIDTLSMTTYFSNLRNLVGDYRDMGYQDLYRLQFDLTENNGFDYEEAHHQGKYQDSGNGTGPVSSFIETSGNWTVGDYQECHPNAFGLYAFFGRIRPWKKIILDGANPWICPCYRDGGHHQIRDTDANGNYTYVLFLDIYFSSDGLAICPADYLTGIPVADSVAFS